MYLCVDGDEYKSDCILVILKNNTASGFNRAWLWCDCNLEKADWTETSVCGLYFFLFKYSSDALRFKFEGF